MDDENFWRSVSLQDMSREQWDRLCDGCGKCCLLKFRDVSSDEIYDSSIACNFLDVQNCRCTSYAARLQVNPECIEMTMEELARNASQWPDTCSYRLVFEGKELPSWHHLISGNAEAVHHQPDATAKTAANERDVRDFRARLRTKIRYESNFGPFGQKHK